MNILHLCSDEKFIDSAIHIFSKLDVRNEFAVITKHPIKYVKSNNINVYKSIVSIGLLKKIREADVIIMHMFQNNYIPLLSLKKKCSIVVWLGWGADYYSRVGLPIDFKIYEDETQSIVSDFISNKNKTHKIFKEIVLSNALAFSVHKIDYFIPVLECEFCLIGNLYKNKSFKYTRWNYPASLSGKRQVGNDILIGNSASLTNNHIEITNKLKGFSLHNKVLMPLSYGNCKYADFIEAEAKLVFGNKLVTLRSFMPMLEYKKLISNVGFAIFNHRRQEALGNILYFLSAGVKVFINPASPIYSYLNQRGFIVYSTDTLAEDSLCKPISEYAYEINNRLCHKYWGESATLSDTQALIEKIKMDLRC